MTLIQGPPGTGKTRVIAAIVAKMILIKEAPKKVLVLTSTNQRADLVAQELIKLDLVDQELFHFDPKRDLVGRRYS